VRLRYALPALADLAAIFDYIAVHSPQSARRVHTRNKAITELPLLYPRIGRRTKAIRRMTVTSYPCLIFCGVTENKVIIHAIRHGARDPSAMPGATAPFDLRLASVGSSKPAQQRLCLFEVGRGKAFGEPAIDRRQHIAGLGATALVAAEAGEAHGGTQLPELGLLLRGHAQGFAIEILGDLGIPLR
jgi:plasmid stabilization system protein ParE